MKNEIEQKIKKMNDYVGKQREIFIGINSAVMNKGFRPSPTQKASINYTCANAKLALNRIENLKLLREK